MCARVCPTEILCEGECVRNDPEDKPVEIGGSLGRREATGRGGMFAAVEAFPYAGIPTAGARVAVQGFGNAGSVSALLLHDADATIVAVSDSKGGVYNAKGLDPHAVLAHKRMAGTVAGFNGADPITNAELLEADCDLLVPAALEKQITAANAARMPHVTSGVRHACSSPPRARSSAERTAPTIAPHTRPDA